MNSQSRFAYKAEVLWDDGRRWPDKAAQSQAFAAKITECLNRRGAEGWDLVNIVHGPHYETGLILAVFRRQSK